MKTVIAILWHKSANRLKMISPFIEERVNLKIYSAAELSDGREDINQLYKEMDTADLFFFNVTAADSVWDEVEDYAAGKTTPVVYVGGEAASRIKNRETMKHSAICNQYYTYSGKENLVNMIAYLLTEVLGESHTYQEPTFIPWEGIFHLDTAAVFETARDYFGFRNKSPKGVIAVIASRTTWLNEDIAVEKELIRIIEARGYTALPIYTYSWPDAELGAKGVEYAVEKFCFDDEGKPVIDAMIRMSGFFLQSADDGKQSKPSSIMNRLNCPIAKPICSASMSIEEWQESKDGTVADLPWSIALPELEGVIEPIFIGAEDRSRPVELRKPVGQRCEKLVSRMIKWIELKKKKNQDKKVVFILNNNPCTSTEASVGGGANLDTLESVARILKTMKQQGYDLEDIPETGDSLIKTIMQRKAISEFRWTTVREMVKKGGVIDFVSREQYQEWFTELTGEARDNMIKAWGEPFGETEEGLPPAMVYEDKMLVTGVSFKNALVCVQPKRGCSGSQCDGKVCKILHDPHIAPTHQYLASYRYFERIYQADVIIHVGTHGNLEFLPGKGAGLSDSCFPDICIGNMPNLYIYNADNPPEGTIAKRRALAVIIDHMQTVMAQGGLYDDLEELDNLLKQVDKVRLSDQTQLHQLEHLVIEEIQKNNLEKEINLDDYHHNFDQVIADAHKVLSTVKNTQIQDGMHIFGELPIGDDRIEMLNAIVRFEGVDQASLRSAVCQLIGVDLKTLLSGTESFSEAVGKNNGEVVFDIDVIGKNIIADFLDGREINADFLLPEPYRIKHPAVLAEINGFRERIIDINRRIDESKEIEALVRAMNGEYVSPGPAGIITRGRDDILPTGRNFYTLDPETVPTKAAWEIGRRLADSVIQKFIDEEGHYPETMAIYWMAADVMWGDGEGLAQLFYLLGVKPKWLPNGKVKGIEVIPMKELGRPRIDVTAKISGILRDNFQNCVGLLDDAIKAVAKLDEKDDQNFVRKHALEIIRENPETTWEDATARIFGVQPGTFTSGVNLMVYASAWEDQTDITDLFTYYNGYAYGRESYGKPAYAQLQNSLKTVEITYDKVMSDEHDLLGCCCYFGNYGGMTAAARELSGKAVKTYYGDTREVTNVEVRTLAEEINRVVRGKLLNPKWIAGQKRHGYKGAGDISKRVGRVYGWEATTEEVDDWIFDDITKTFIIDADNRAFFRDNNPWALEEMSRRLMEAYQRGLWQPEAGMIEEIQDSYLELEGFLEEDMGSDAGDFQGSAIEIIKADEFEEYRKTMSQLHGAKKKN
ncbi:cobaltochelatase subunit CobN [Acetobacterium paludosum]|uniref:Cobaltochelatase subunit CobN n=1 Tax=Acetobacterium paludosum TaxID=52693 RepID=A0A923HSK5_9FIRM|nr:cobaltochelatase subunit CobN [Acetobacterium paludosum]MBC3887873.1 cobaltochelatase subunit CobN [Acetobacterium paludosum]